MAAHWGQTTSSTKAWSFIEWQERPSPKRVLLVLTSETTLPRWCAAEENVLGPSQGTWILLQAVPLNSRYLCFDSSLKS